MTKKHTATNFTLLFILICSYCYLYPQNADAGPWQKIKQRLFGNNADDIAQENHNAPLRTAPQAYGTRRFALDLAAVPQLIQQTVLVGDDLSEIQGVSFAMWGRVQPRAPIAGKPQYRGLDRLADSEKDFIRKFKQTNRKLSVVLEFYYNDWALTFSDNIMVKSPRSGEKVHGFVRIKKEYEQAWKDFIKHYISIVPKLQYIQIDNEPENVWVDGDGYARALRLAYEAVQEYNAQHGADIKVMAAGFYLTPRLIQLPENIKEHLYKNYPNIDEQWIRREINLPPGVTSRQIQHTAQKVHVVMSTLRQKEPAFDILTVHLDGTRPYDKAEEVITWYKSQMKSMGYDRPVWVDDVNSGYYAEQGPKASPLDKRFFSEIGKNNKKAIARHTRVQPAWLVRKATGYFAAGFERIKIAQLIDNPNYFMPVWRYPGLFNVKFEPKPAFYTTKLLVEKLDYFKAAIKLDNYSYRFTFNNKDDIYVAWSEKGNRLLDLSRQMETTQARITYLINEVDKHHKPITRDSVIVPANRIPLTEEPIFIEGVAR